MSETTIQDQLRQAIREAVEHPDESQRWTLNALAAACGVPQSRLHEWLHRGRSLTGRHLDSLAAWTGCRLTRPRVPRPQGTR